jgi:rRNA-processing protein FCF1
MAKQKARRAIIREWMALAREKRQSGRQALAFAKAVIERRSLVRSRRTPHDVIMGWLRPRTGRP